MRVLIIASLLFLMPMTAAAEWVLQPPVLVNGGVGIVRWQDDVPMDVAIAKFRGERFFLDRDKEGLFALVGIDVLTEPGRYPLELSGIDRRGRNIFHSISVEVVDAERKVDRLTLPPEMVEPKAPKTVARIERESAELKQLFGENSGPFIGGLFSTPVTDPISSDFGTRRILNGVPKSPHSGTDFRSPLGTVVRAPANGRVVLVKDLYYTGRTVVIDHGNGLYSLYAHLLKPLCRTGDELDAGAAIGKVGSTGRSTGAHLHWTIKLHGAKVDPVELLRRYGKERP